MTAWNLLIMHSVLPSGTAWQHLNAQEGGGEGLVVSDGIEISLALEPVVAELQMQDIGVDVQDLPVVVEIEDAPDEVFLVTSSFELEVV